MPHLIECWFEFASTYSYPAVARLETVAGIVGARVAWKPFLLGPIFKAQGWDDSPFKIYPAKGAYMWRDLERVCAKHRVPFRRPSRFPRNGLLAARVALIAAAEGWASAFAPAVYRANFVDDLDIGDPEVVGGIVHDLGQDAAAVLDRAHGDDVRQALRAQTETAVSRGIFGAPSLVVDGELFWGHDRLEDAVAWACRAG